MNKNRIYPTYFVFGALLLYTVLFVLPSVIGLGYSFTDWSVYSDEIRFVGLKNIPSLIRAFEPLKHRAQLSSRRHRSRGKTGGPKILSPAF